MHRFVIITTSDPVGKQRWKNTMKHFEELGISAVTYSFTKHPTDGTQGCWNSHQKVVKDSYKLFKKDGTLTTICEDDVRWSENWRDWATIIIPKLKEKPDPIDIAFAGISSAEGIISFGRIDEKSRYSYIQPVASCGFFSYCPLTATGFESILNAKKTISDDIDCAVCYDREICSIRCVFPFFTTVSFDRSTRLDKSLTGHYYIVNNTERDIGEGLGETNMYPYLRHKKMRVELYNNDKITD